MNILQFNPTLSVAMDDLVGQLGQWGHRGAIVWSISVDWNVNRRGYR